MATMTIKERTRGKDEGGRRWVGHMMHNFDSLEVIGMIP